jgi:hypothetical protein
MRAELVDQAQPVLGIAKCDEPLGKKLHADRRAIRLRKLGRKQRRQPVAPKELAHRRPRTGARQKLVLIRSHEPTFTLRV